VYDLYQSHQAGRALRTVFEAPDVNFAINGERRRLPGLSGSASLKNGRLTLSVVNPHATLSADAAIVVRGGQVREASAATLTHDELTAHNTFDEPNALAPRNERLTIDGEWRHTFPPASVTVIVAEVTA